MTTKSLFQAIGTAVCWALLASGTTATATAADASGLDPEGYIRDWIMLAPIPLPEGRTPADLILREQIANEAALKPAAGDKITVRGRELVWTKVTASTNYFDFNATLKTLNDQAAGFLVTYVECDQEIPDVTMAVASNDQGRIYFNGIDIYAVTEARTLLLDADKGRVTLKKGLNVIVFKIINEQNAWQAAMRLLDKTGSPLTHVRIRSAP
ncbi:MAG: hypothetical protein AB7J34_14665 [Limisphaerales bacterium]